MDFCSVKLDIQKNIVKKANASGLFQSNPDSFVLAPVEINQAVADWVDSVNTEFRSEVIDSNYKVEPEDALVSYYLDYAIVEQARNLSNQVSGIYKMSFASDPRQSLFEFAVQANSSASERASATKIAGPEIMDLALQLFPNVKVGDKYVEQKPFVSTKKPANEVDFTLKAANILQSPKAVEVFEKGAKNNWDLNKILTELQIPKEQKQLILDLGITDREQIILELSSKYNYIVEINTAKDVRVTPKKEVDFTDDDYENLQRLDADQLGLPYDTEDLGNSQHYSNLTVNKDFYKNNPDWEYKEQRITTPLITPSIKGHAQFAQDNDIGWFRAWYNKKTGEVHVLEVQSDLFQKGRDKEDLVINNKTENISYEDPDNDYADENGIVTETVEDVDNRPNINKQNQFLQLLNKDNNWVTFFIRAIIQQTAKERIYEASLPDIEEKVLSLQKEGKLKIDCK